MMEFKTLLKSVPLKIVFHFSMILGVKIGCFEFPEHKYNQTCVETKNDSQPQRLMWQNHQIQNLRKLNTIKSILN